MKESGTITGNSNPVLLVVNFAVYSRNRPPNAHRRLFAAATIPAAVTFRFS